MRRQSRRITLGSIGWMSALAFCQADAIAQLKVGTRTKVKTLAKDEGEAVRESATVRYHGIPKDYGEAMANVVDTAARMYHDEFGLAIPQRAIVTASLDRKNRPGIRVNGPDELLLQLSKPEQLKSPGESRVFDVYALVYELAELSQRRMIGEAPWMTDAASKGLSYYLASEAIDRLNIAYSRSLWPDKYDYAGEGIRLMEQRARNRNGPEMVQAAFQWRELTRLQGKGALGALLTALNKAQSEQRPAESAIRDLPGAKDVRGRPKLDRWFRRFEGDLLVSRNRQGRGSRSTGAVQLRRDPVTLEFDDGNGRVDAISAGNCPTVFFQREAGDWYLTKVRFFGAFTTAGASSEPIVHLCNRDMQIIDSWPVSSSERRGTSPRWREVVIKPIKVPAEFAIVLEVPSNGSRRSASDAAKTSAAHAGGAATSQPTTESANASGLSVGVDDSHHGHSAVGTPGVSARPFDGGEWMIHAVIDTDRTTNPLLWRP